MTLRIQRSDDEPGWVIFTLTGRIQAEQLPELEDLLKAELNDQHLMLDLKDVKLVDRDAVRFLAQLESEGTTLRNCSAFIREWLRRERNGMTQTRESNQQLR
jgi:anti-anti-sigma regulatory factor